MKSGKALLLRVCISGWVLCLAAPGIGPFFEETQAASAVVAPAASLQELKDTINAQARKVSEFNLVRTEAERLGVRAWLFGGTAASFGHYVKQDLQRLKGDHRYQPERFDYEYDSIYRSSQDLDIVIDGPPEMARELQARLEKAIPHMKGNRSAWEVRLLRQDLGDKQALLDNPDFLNQHTDSNSTGMIELTRPPSGEAAVRDLRDWNSSAPRFLKDVHEGKLHYYFSPAHESTTYSKQGRNPPIFSVIRYLTKAFQFDLEPRAEDLALIRKIIDDYDPKDPKTDYVKNWLEHYGAKLIQNAVNLEKAVATLDQLGLRSKLRATSGDPGRIESLAWWMNKEPLRSQPLGTSGRTAAELFSEKRWAKPGEPLIVSHETNTLFTYESIISAPSGEPNVLNSRKGAKGEAALHGDGFYTQVGKRGGRGTHITVRFALDPAAREGADFTVANDTILIKNKTAIRVIPESLDLEPLHYFRQLHEGRALAKTEDQALVERLHRRLRSRIGTFSDEHYLEIRKVIAESVASGRMNVALISEWAKMPRSAQFSAGLFAPLLSSDRHHDLNLYRHVYSKPAFQGLPEAAKIIASGRDLEVTYNKLIRFELARDLLQKAITEAGDNARIVAHNVLNSSDVTHHGLAPHVAAAGSDGALIEKIAQVLGSRPQAEEHGLAREFFEHIIAKNPQRNWESTLIQLLKQDASYAFSVDELGKKGVPLSDNTVIAQIDAIQKLDKFAKPPLTDSLITHILSRGPMRHHRKSISHFFRSADVETNDSRSLPWVLKTLLDSQADDSEKETLAKDILRVMQERGRAALITPAIQKQIPDPQAYLLSVYADPQNSAEWRSLLNFIQEHPQYRAESERLLALPHWRDHPEFRLRAKNKEPTLARLFPAQHGLLSRCREFFSHL